MDRLPDGLLAADREAAQPTDRLYVDAGIAHLRLLRLAPDGSVLADELLPSNRDLRRLFAERREVADAVFVTGKLAPTVSRALGGGHVFMPAGALWLAARDLIAASPDAVRSLAVVEMSASGYLLVGVDRQGALKDDLLAPNPRCGAGTGVNVDRVLQKLGLRREDVDELLADYLGEAGREKRAAVLTRADRCGVFSSSATISDKNQGIPLATALATTLKSEVLKTMRKLPAGFDKVVLAGRFFRWRFVRDCAVDHLDSMGIADVVLDADNTAVLMALHRMVTRIGVAGLSRPDPRLGSVETADEHPAFAALKARLEADGHYLRLAPDVGATADAAMLRAAPVFLALDVGSTMAKVTIAAGDGEVLFASAYGNAGDTIETVKEIFRDLQGRGVGSLGLRAVGITGSARYQVREALSRIYPNLAARIEVMVENYAHARGSIDLARQHVARMKERGVAEVNEDFCVLVDIGGEDTKISTVALKEAELFNNAMNIKCSAGTGSLMDTLSSLFGIAGAGAASALAMGAPRAFAINATCAVFLMESARKLQAQGVPQEEILASANWAIVENMARTLWNQIDLPKNTVLLLHGQTMLSDPLPLAVAHRFVDHQGQPAYALVPPYPGHRACFGLVRSLMQTAPEGSIAMPLATFVDARFDKRIIQCKAAACNDPAAVCNRTSLKCRDAEGKHFTFTLGGCSAVNELFARAHERKAGAADAAVPPAQPADTYKAIWDFVDARMPRSDDPDRLVIPRSFVVSEWAGFLAQFFAALGLPVHVDNVRETDLIEAQPFFNIDSCAPHMGAVGQYRRLAGQVHGIIVAPQIERLDTGGKSLGRTCTLNQGGVAVAANMAQAAYPRARIQLFHLDLSQLDAAWIAAQLHDRLAAVFAHYGLAPGREEIVAAAAAAISAHRTLKAELAEYAAGLIEQATAAGFPVALVVGREYLLNPGIYDSHVRRLLRDKRMAAIPSYVLDMDLDEEFGTVYWRNPHFILSALKAVAARKLHARLRSPRLADAFRRTEESAALLPVVQVSTFCCGPDSVTSHLVAEVMKKRPFLLIQSDAVIKELAHLENRVNTYVRQLESGLHDRLALESGETISMRALDELENRQGIDRERDVIYVPTLGDNRSLTAVLRGAGYQCVDNYAGISLPARIKLGRAAAGDAVCAPLAGVYGDLMRALDDFRRRKASGEFAGRKRLLYFNNKGSGPCRQGQYAEVHKLLVHRHLRENSAAALAHGAGGCDAASGEGWLRFLVAQETAGYEVGIPEWVMLRLYLGVILQGVLHEVMFSGAAACRDYAEYERFMAEYAQLKADAHAALAAYQGPGRLARAMSRRCGAIPVFGDLVRLFAGRLYDPELRRLLARFARRWRIGAPPAGRPLAIHIAGEAYMRVAQSEDIFHALLADLGFGRFRLHGAPLWSYLEYLLEEADDEIRKTPGVSPGQAAARCGRIFVLRFLLRHLLAAPLYRAAGVHMPASARSAMAEAKAVLPTLRPQGELAPYLGEVLLGLRQGADLVLNVAPSGCMVSTMAEVLTPSLCRMAGRGRIQHLFSADGEVNDELLSLAALKAMGPEAYFRRSAMSASAACPA
jgi:activator of 2-hydroxyglutaryl-CoA dehydratase/predicted nucleotide-binding protein (sugar kinase/HSP70/actin superfamily)